MAAHHDLIKRLDEDETLRSAILAAPTREAKHDAVRDAGLAVPDHQEVLQEVAGGWSDADTAGAAFGTPAAMVAAMAAAAAAV